MEAYFLVCCTRKHQGQLLFLNAGDADFEYLNFLRRFDGEINMRKFFNVAWNMIPSRYRVSVDIYRRYQYWKNAGAIFIHVPKVAGVSVSSALYGRPLGHFRAVDVRQILPRAFETLFTFGIVRDPLKRLLSAYRFAIAGGGEKMKIKNPSKYQSSEFRSFASFVSEWLIYQERNRLDGIFKPQNFFLCDCNEIIVDHWFNLDSLNEGMEIVGSKLGQAIPLEHLNRTFGRSNWDIDRDTIDLVQRYYADDYEIFGFSFA